MHTVNGYIHATAAELSLCNTECDPQTLNAGPLQRKFATPTQTFPAKTHEELVTVLASVEWFWEDRSEGTPLPGGASGFYWDYITARR